MHARSASRYGRDTARPRAPPRGLCRRPAAPRSAPSCPVPCLARRDVAFLAEQVVELVDAIQQAVARESLDWEGDTASVRQSEDLGLEIDVNLDTGVGDEKSM